MGESRREFFFPNYMHTDGLDLAFVRCMPLFGIDWALRPCPCVLFPRKYAGCVDGVASRPVEASACRDFLLGLDFGVLGL